MKLQLGHQVFITNVLHRESKWVWDNEKYSRTEHKIWGKKLIEPKYAMLIGIRTLSNGYCIYDSDAGNLYHPEHYFKAYLVVDSLYRKPYFTLLKNG